MQVENEYGYYESAYGEGGKRYTIWAANMSVSQNTGVPWIMCQQYDPPDTVVSTHHLFNLLIKFNSVTRKPMCRNWGATSMMRFYQLITP